MPTIIEEDTRPRGLLEIAWQYATTASRTGAQYLYHFLVPVSVLVDTVAVAQLNQADTPGLSLVKSENLGPMLIGGTAACMLYSAAATYADIETAVNANPSSRSDSQKILLGMLRFFNGMLIGGAVVNLLFDTFGDDPSAVSNAELTAYLIASGVAGMSNAAIDKIFKLWQKLSDKKSSVENGGPVVEVLDDTSDVESPALEMNSIPLVSREALSADEKQEDLELRTVEYASNSTDPEETEQLKTPSQYALEQTRDTFIASLLVARHIIYNVKGSVPSIVISNLLIATIQYAIAYQHKQKYPNGPTPHSQLDKLLTVLDSIRKLITYAGWIDMGTTFLRSLFESAMSGNYNSVFAGSTYSSFGTYLYEKLLPVVAVAIPGAWPEDKPKETGVHLDDDGNLTIVHNNSSSDYYIPDTANSKQKFAGLIASRRYGNKINLLLKEKLLQDENNDRPAASSSAPPSPERKTDNNKLKRHNSH